MMILKKCTMENIISIFLCPDSFQSMIFLSQGIVWRFPIQDFKNINVAFVFNN